eukprot:CAMPEP_0117692300 /NCGR_PEP_ID=MMETSP0804-20121206/26249_1 /TAXON_ID=1074897 /ORGANISM="Tetraselmis astigmatica, Strain CCMP880" /LENGTH=61 /DNA_ID=CAMNT_0005505729 /DNA_START=385 /DNA_END=570 /DNA_ORIENTATION=-
MPRARDLQVPPRSAGAAELALPKAVAIAVLVVEPITKVALLAVSLSSTSANALGYTLATAF